MNFIQKIELKRFGNLLNRYYFSRFDITIYWDEKNHYALANALATRESEFRFLHFSAIFWQIFVRFFGRLLVDFKEKGKRKNEKQFVICHFFGFIPLVFRQFFGFLFPFSSIRQTFRFDLQISRLFGRCSDQFFEKLEEKTTIFC